MPAAQRRIGLEPHLRDRPETTPRLASGFPFDQIPQGRGSAVMLRHQILSKVRINTDSGQFATAR
jgi:hypothetical protein